MNEPSIEKHLYAEVTEHVDENTMGSIIKEIANRSSCLADGIYHAMEQAMNESYPNPVSTYVGRGDNLVFVNLRNGEFHIFYQTDNATMMTSCSDASFNYIAKHCAQN